MSRGLWTEALIFRNWKDFPHKGDTLECGLIEHTMKHKDSRAVRLVEVLMVAVRREVIGAFATL